MSKIKKIELDVNGTTNSFDITDTNALHKDLSSKNYIAGIARNSYMVNDKVQNFGHGLFENEAGIILKPWGFAPQFLPFRMEMIPANDDKKFDFLSANEVHADKDDKLTLSFIVFIEKSGWSVTKSGNPATVTDQTKSNYLHGFKITNSGNSKDWYYRVGQKDFGSLQTVNILETNLPREYKHNSTTYDRCVIVNLQCTRNTTNHRINFDFIIEHNDDSNSGSSKESLPMAVIARTGHHDLADTSFLNETKASSGGGSSTLAGLTDTDIQSPSAGDELVYDGNKWKKATPTAPYNESYTFNLTTSLTQSSQTTSTANAWSIPFTGLASQSIKIPSTSEASNFIVAITGPIYMRQVYKWAIKLFALRFTDSSGNSVYIAETPHADDDDLNRHSSASFASFFTNKDLSTLGLTRGTTYTVDLVYYTTDSIAQYITRDSKIRVNINGISSGTQVISGGSSGGGVSDPDKAIFAVEIGKETINTFATNTWQQSAIFSSNGASSLTDSGVTIYKGTSITKKDDNTIYLEKGTYSIYTVGGYSDRGSASTFDLCMKITNSDILTTTSYLWGTHRTIPANMAPLALDINDNTFKSETPQIITVTSKAELTLWQYLSAQHDLYKCSMSIIKIG